MADKRPVRFLPVYKPGKEHAGHVDGWIVHHEDRRVREAEPQKPKRGKKAVRR